MANAPAGLHSCPTFEVGKALIDGQHNQSADLDAKIQAGTVSACMFMLSSLHSCAFLTTLNCLYTQAAQQQVAALQAELGADAGVDDRLQLSGLARTCLILCFSA